MQAVTRRNRIHPHKMVLYVGIASLVMLFVALTSAYIVRRAAGNWLEFSIPSIFYLNTLVILLSSLTLHIAYRAFIKGSARRYKTFVTMTLVLGLVFLIMQFAGWEALAAQGVPLKINPSGDFVYAFGWLHAAHVIGGIAVLSVSVALAYLLPLRVTAARKLRLELTITYWHFLDALWIYLIIFLSLQR